MSDRIKNVFKQRLMEFPGQFPTAFGGGICEVDLYEVPGEGHIVVIREIAENKGCSTVNCIENVALQACRDFNLDPNRVVILNHLGPFSYENGDREEEWSLADMAWHEEWQRFGRPAWGFMGRTLEEVLANPKALPRATRVIESTANTAVLQ